MLQLSGIFARILSSSKMVATVKNNFVLWSLMCEKGQNDVSLCCITDCAVICNCTMQ